MEDYNLQSEDVFEKMSRYKVRSQLLQNGATPEEAAFLVERRVELNAFTSDQLLEWLEGKLQMHCPGTVTIERRFKGSAKDQSPILCF